MTLKSATRAMAVLVALHQPPASATPSVWNDIQGAQAAFDCTIQRARIGKTVQITLTCDLEKLIASLPMLQAMHLVHSPLTHRQIKNEPTIIGLSFLLQDTVGMIPLVYGAMSMNRSHWTVNLKAVDPQGRRHAMQAFSFRFNQALASRTDWSGLQPRNLSRLAPGFRFSHWAKTRMRAEQD